MKERRYSDTSLEQRLYYEGKHQYVEMPWDPNDMVNLGGYYEMDGEIGDEEAYHSRRKEMLYKIHCAIKQLTVKQQKVVKLFLSGKSDIEISKVLGVHQTSVSIAWHGSSYPGGGDARYGGIIRRIKVLVGEITSTQAGKDIITDEKIQEIKRLAKHHTTKQVAEEAGVSEATVEKYYQLCSRGHDLKKYGRRQKQRDSGKYTRVCRECRRLKQIENRAERLDKTDIAPPEQCKHGHPYPEYLGYYENSRGRIQRYCKKCNSLNAGKKRDEAAPASYVEYTKLNALL